MAADTLTDAEAEVVRLAAGVEAGAYAFLRADQADTAAILDQAGFVEAGWLFGLIPVATATPAGREALARHESEVRDA